MLARPRPVAGGISQRETAPTFSASESSRLGEEWDKVAGVKAMKASTLFRIAEAPFDQASLFALSTISGAAMTGAFLQYCEKTCGCNFELDLRLAFDVTSLWEDE